jgi:hypothetical protein
MNASEVKTFFEAQARAGWSTSRRGVESWASRAGKQTAQPSKPHSEMVRRTPRNWPESRGNQLRLSEAESANLQAKSGV